MARKRKRKSEPAAAKPPQKSTEAPAPKPKSGAKPVPKPIRVAPAEQPAFWFGYEVAWPKLLVARVVLFGLLALDAMMQIRHAPRYGTGFNVAQLPLLDHYGPGRVTFLASELMLAYLFVLAAFGVATRVVVPIAAVIYAWLYFGSQLDSYQHHYLVAILLGISSFIPWGRPADPSKPVRAWAVRLFLVQLGIMYLWAAISKLDRDWLDGHALASQLGSAVTGPDRLSVVGAIVEHTFGWTVMAWVVVLTEFTLAGTVWIKRLAIVAAPLGLALHFGIVLSKLEIGLFAWLMIAMYALVIPDRVWNLLARVPLRTPRAGWGAFAILAVAGMVLAWRCRIDLSTVLGLLALVTTITIAMLRRDDVLPIAGAFAATMLLWMCVDRLSTVTTDYYRLWGGSARRLGDKASAERAYRTWIAVDASDPTPHFRLGRVLVEDGHTTDGLVELRAADSLGSPEARQLIQQVEKGGRPHPNDD